MFFDVTILLKVAQVSDLCLGLGWYSHALDSFRLLCGEVLEHVLIL